MNVSNSVNQVHFLIFVFVFLFLFMFMFIYHNTISRYPSVFIGFLLYDMPRTLGYWMSATNWAFTAVSCMYHITTGADGTQHALRSLASRTIKQLHNHTIKLCQLLKRNNRFFVEINMWEKAIRGAEILKEGERRVIILNEIFLYIVHLVLIRSFNLCE